MFQTGKLKPDRSIGGWIVPLSVSALFGISLLILGYRRAIFVLAGLILLYALYSLYVFLRTMNAEHLVVCAYQVFLGITALFLPSYVGTNRAEPPTGVVAYVTGLVFFGVLIVFLTVTRRLKWRGREVLELAAETVEETGNGYTPRPRPVGRVDFSNLFIDLSRQGYSSLADAQAAGAPTINYGVFLNTLIDFLIVAFAIFLVIRAVNRLQRKEEAAPPEPDTKECPYCFTTIAIKATRCPNCTSQL